MEKEIYYYDIKYNKQKIIYYLSIEIVRLLECLYYPCVYMYTQGYYSS